MPTVTIRTAPHLPPRRIPAAPQRGLVLVLALIVLAAMSLAAVGLMRGVLGSNRVAGNLAFQEATLQAGDVGVETAVAWLEQKSLETAAPKPPATTPLPANKLFGDLKKANGEAYNYVATRSDPVASQGWETLWTQWAAADQVNQLDADAAGNSVAFVIHRLCRDPGDPSTSRCEATPTLPTSIKTSSKSNSLKLSETSQVYYRVTVRVQGARNSVSYIQAIVAI